MAVRKQGELRIRKGEAIYGPMTREDLESLLASRRFTLTDLVSVWDGPWMSIHQYLAPRDTQAVPAAPLRVLRGEHVFGSLGFEELRRLCDEGRIAGDDLVCAAGGPWMSVADFLAPPELVVADAEVVPEAEVLSEDDLDDEDAFDEQDDVPPTWYRMYSGDLEEQLSDRWFVRVRGIHSAPLTRHQVRQLLLAAEITPHNVARHCTWHEENWRPISQIPELDLRQ